MDKDKRFPRDISSWCLAQCTSQTVKNLPSVQYTGHMQTQLLLSWVTNTQRNFPAWSPSCSHVQDSRFDVFSSEIPLETLKSQALCYWVV